MGRIKRIIKGIDRWLERTLLEPNRNSVARRCATENNYNQIPEKDGDEIMGRKRIANITAAAPESDTKALGKGKSRKRKPKAEKEQKVVVIVSARGKSDEVSGERGKQAQPVQPQVKEKPQVDEKAILRQLRNQPRISRSSLPRITHKMPKLR